MKILYPEAFWLLTIILLLLVPAVLNYRKGTKSLGVLAGLWRSSESRQIYFIKTLIYWVTIYLFLIFTVLALAGMSWGKTTAKDESSGFDLIVAVDVSRSMLADDIKPSRLSRSAESLASILNSFEGIRAGIVIFKGRGEILVPLTEDHIQLEAGLRSLSPDLYTIPGSDIEQGLLSAIEAFPAGSPGKQAILLVTDGESLQGEAGNAAREAYLREIPLFILGAGSTDGIILRDKNGDIIKDSGGQPVVSRLDEEILGNLADLSGGAYYNLSDPRSQGEITMSLHELTEGQGAEGIKYQDQYQFRIFIILALLSLAVNLFLGGIRWSKWF